MYKLINKISIFVFVLLFSNSIKSQSINIFSPKNPLIQYQGRINFSDSLKPIFSFPGISIKVKFNGTSIKAKFRGYKGKNPQTNFFNVFVDDTFSKKFELGDTLINVDCAHDLARGVHVVEITKRTESMLGKVEFLGFEIDGDLLEVDPLPGRKIEFVGNSITCGYGNEDKSTGGFTSVYENNYLAFGAVCARELNSQYRAIAYSGRGVIYNYACSKGDSIPEVYDKILADEKALDENIYNHNSYNPDIIVVNLGTNDHNCNKTTDDNFKNAYINFISKLKKYHPTTRIICLTGPMNTSQVFKDRIEYIVAKSGGESKGIYYYHQTRTIDVTYKGGHGHPNTKMADINGKELAKFIEEKDLFKYTSIDNSDINSNKKKVYPNPALNNEFNVDLREFDDNKEIELRIYTVYNELVLRKDLKSNSINKIDINFESGLYILVLKNKNKVYLEKLIVK